MNKIKAYNFISFSTIVFPLVFLGKYLTTNSNSYLIALAGLVFTNISSELLKYNIFKNNTRPALARDCNLMNNDGLQGGKPGMPSSHAAITTYFVATYLYLNYKENSKNSKNNYIMTTFLLTYLYLVLLSRFKKHCHSLTQLSAGFLFGLFNFLLFFPIYKIYY